MTCTLAVVVSTLMMTQHLAVDGHSSYYTITASNQPSAITNDFEHYLNDELKIGRDALDGMILDALHRLKLPQLQEKLGENAFFESSTKQPRGGDDDSKVWSLFGDDSYSTESSTVDVQTTTTENSSSRRRKVGPVGAAVIVLVILGTIVGCGTFSYCIMRKFQNNWRAQPGALMFVQVASSAGGASTSYPVGQQVYHPTTSNFNTTIGPTNFGTTPSARPVAPNSYNFVSTDQWSTCSAKTTTAGGDDQPPSYPGI